MKKSATNLLELATVIWSSRTSILRFAGRNESKISSRHPFSNYTSVPLANHIIVLFLLTINVYSDYPGCKLLN